MFQEMFTELSVSLVELQRGQHNCELNDANTKMEPEALREKEEVTYYEPVRSYFGNRVRKSLYIQSF